MVAHGGMVNHLYAKVRDLGLGPRDVVAQTAALSFDVSVWQCFAALLVGGRVRIYGDEVAHEPRALLAATGADAVSVLEVVPAVLDGLLAAAGAPAAGAAGAPGRPELPELPGLRWLVATGEALPPELCRRWLDRFPGVPLLNAYGPTECSDDVTHHPIATPPAPDAPRVPIGRPIANTRLYVLDARRRPAPVGVPGELYVGGAGVARGYLGRPGLTATAFVPDPFAPAPGGRLYRTGDLVRQRPDGVLEFLGRLDHQVKLRGFRIELGEIEAALTTHPAVRAAAVLVRADLPGGPRLVAYVVPQAAPADATDAAAGESPDTADPAADPAADAAALREHLRARLPEYMVPAHVVVLAALPLTPNGKVDRAALPAPTGAPDGGAAYVAPRTAAEAVLAGVWTEVLGLPPDRVGAHDNFFELGGHSLLATQVVARVRDLFGTELPLRALFEAPTVAGLAEEMSQDPEQRHRFERTAELLLTLAQLSDDDAEAMLENETATALVE
jgi:acyl-coenzyme A synthetase/AMP-(fatty) acid ligase/acyl carrier protein